MLDNFISAYCRAIGYLIAAMLALMVVLVFGNVVTRYPRNCRAGCLSGSPFWAR